MVTTNPNSVEAHVFGANSALLINKTKLLADDANAASIRTRYEFRKIKKTFL
jgi:hypothetical protein